MALRVHATILAAATPVRRDTRSAHQSTSLPLASPGWNSDAKISRREAFSSFFLAAAAPAFQGVSFAVQAKNLNLPIVKIKDIIENDIRNGQYYITGNLTQAIYEDDCRFIDPTTDLRGVDKYVAAIKFLFDPNTSHHELISIDVVSPNKIEAKWKLEGYLKFPWHPHIKPYGGTTVYEVNDKGLITSHEETWDISLWTAFLEFLTPSLLEGYLALPRTQG